MRYRLTFTKYKSYSKIKKKKEWFVLPYDRHRLKGLRVAGRVKIIFLLLLLKLWLTLNAFCG